MYPILSILSPSPSLKRTQRKENFLSRKFVSRTKRSCKKIHGNTSPLGKFNLNDGRGRFCCFVLIWGEKKGEKRGKKIGKVEKGFWLDCKSRDSQTDLRYCGSPGLQLRARFTDFRTQSLYLSSNLQVLGIEEKKTKVGLTDQFMSNVIRHLAGQGPAPRRDETRSICFLF